MGLWDIVTGIVQQNIGVDIARTLLIIIILGSIILMAYNFQIGLVVSLFLSSGLYMLFKNFDLNYSPFLIITFIYIILLALSLWASSRVAQEGAYI